MRKYLKKKEKNIIVTKNAFSKMVYSLNLQIESNC